MLSQTLGKKLQMIDTSNKKKGIFFAIFSATIYGLMPIFSLIFYSFGVNPISLVFYRFVLSTPFLWILASKEIHMKISLSELKQILFLSLFFSLTPILLYISYSYIGAGTATTLHFTYPAGIFLLNRFILKNKSSRKERISLFITLIAIILMGEFSSEGNVFGFLFAVVSGFTYAIYTLYLDKSGLAKMNVYKLLFYVSLFSSIFCLIFANSLGGLIYKFNGIEWLYFFLFSLILTIFATGFYQIATREIGANKTSLLGTFEPLVGVIMGILVFKESIDFKKILAMILILCSSLLITKDTKK